MKLIWIISAMKKYGLSLEYVRNHFTVTHQGHCIGMGYTSSEAMRAALKNLKETSE